MRRYLTIPERRAAAAVGFVLVLVALGLFAYQPDRTQLVPQCVPSARASCLANVDSDPSVFAGVIAALGGAAILVAVLGIRFSSIKAAGVELGGMSFGEQTDGLERVGAQTPARRELDHRAGDLTTAETDVESIHSSGTIEFTPATLDQLLLYQHWGRDQRGAFLGHLVNPIPMGGRWEVAVFVTRVVSPHDVDDVKKAEFYFGPGWRSRVFEGKRDRKGRPGCVVAAFTDFVAYCRVTFDDGHTVLLQHYCNIDGPEAFATRPVR